MHKIFFYFMTRMIFNLLLLFVHMWVRAVCVCVEGTHDKLLVWNSERLCKLSSLTDSGIELRLCVERSFFIC